MHQLYDQREAEFTEPVMRQIEKIVMLQTLDMLWKDHLLAMDHLKEGIGLRGYAQQNPLVEYQKEGFSMFEALMAVMQTGRRRESFFGAGAEASRTSSRFSRRQAAARRDEPRRRDGDAGGGAGQARSR